MIGVWWRYQEAPSESPRKFAGLYEKRESRFNYPVLLYMIIPLSAPKWARRKKCAKKMSAAIQATLLIIIDKVHTSAPVVRGSTCFCLAWASCYELPIYFRASSDNLIQY